MTTRRGRGRPPHPDVLTPTEWRILDAVRHGMSRREIATRRGTSADAVRYHVRNIGSKIGVGGVAALRAWPGVPAGTRVRNSTSREGNPTMALGAIRLGHLGQVSLYVKEIPSAEAFYRDVLGLDHHFTFGDLAFFDMDGVRLYLHAVPDETWRPGSVLYFVVDDIARAQDELAERGVHFTGAPHRIHADEATGTEEWMTFFEDPFGNTLALMSRVNAGRTGDESPERS
jgi:DNA-binding CsgD family transcriptional regulator/predicted enzyme related to lactoylglutathione lyase